MRLQPLKRTGVMTHGSTRDQALAPAKALALRVLADKMERWLIATALQAPMRRDNHSL